MAFTNQTVTYSETSKGFPSFYSFIPEQIKGMNGYLYTFYQGKLWQHNSSTALRNTFYGSTFSTTITSVFNQSPLENKLFKTIGIQSDSAWSATLKSDLQDTGSISYSYFVQKEGEWFAYLRSNPANPISGEFPLRSVQGVGGQTVRTGVGTGVCVLTFDMAVDLGSMINEGDTVYYAIIPNPVTDPYTPIEAGPVSSVNYDAANNINNITINNSATALPATGTEVYILYIKNQIAESNGILGHYGEFTLTNGLVENPNSLAVELFAVDSDVMKSFP
tara:strand:+ start:87 stop:917 length:831 start_codon:yes stop_codon:yes gene_type:complete